MDTGDGKFKIFQESEALEEQRAATIARMERDHPNHGGWFRVGDIVEIRGSQFRIKSIKPNELRLKLLPRQRKLTTP